MGLELVFGVERRFGIEIPIAEYSKWATDQHLTVDRFVDFVWQRLPPSEVSIDAYPEPDASDALVGIALSWLQNELRNNFAPNAATLQDFPPELRLEQLPGKPSARQVFAALRQSKLMVPQLYLSNSQLMLSGFLAIGIALSVIAQLHFRLSSIEGWLVNGICAAGLTLVFWGCLLFAFSHYLATKTNCTTVGELARDLLLLNPQFFCRIADQKIFRALVHASLVEMLADLLGLDRDRITPSARLIEDLGMD